jgi:hypothetical protein
MGWRPFAWLPRLRLPGTQGLTLKRCFHRTVSRRWLPFLVMGPAFLSSGRARSISSCCSVRMPANTGSRMNSPTRRPRMISRTPHPRPTLTDATPDDLPLLPAPQTQSTPASPGLLNRGTALADDREPEPTVPGESTMTVRVRLDACRSAGQHRRLIQSRGVALPFAPDVVCHLRVAALLERLGISELEQRRLASGAATCESLLARLCRLADRAQD